MNWYKISQGLLWGLLVLNVMVFLAFTGNAQRNLTCSGFQIIWEGDVAEKFIQEKEVELFLEDGMSTDHLIGQTLSQMNPGLIESIALSNPYIQKALCYQDIQGHVFLHIWPRKAIARVVNQGGGYYISSDAYKMPLSNKYTARVPIVSGAFYEGSEYKDTLVSLEGKKLFTLLQAIVRDTFTNALVSQIEVDQNGEYQLYPSLGETVIHFGDTADLSEKLYKLRVIYSKVLNNRGWNHYQYLNLKFRNQVLAVPFSSQPRTVFKENEG